MTPEERSLLERTHKLAEENNSMLRSIRRTNRIAAIARIGYWVVILIASFGAYYFIQPYLTTMLDLYGQMTNGTSSSSLNADSFKDIFK